MKKEIVEKISSYFKISDFEAERIYDNIFETIIDGVRKDNIAEVDRLGEFIARSSPGNPSNKIIEFLPSQFLEDEIRYFNPASSEALQVLQETSSSHQNISDDLKKKREEILSKIAAPVVSNPLESEASNQNEVQESVSTELEKESKKSFSDYFSELKEEHATLEGEKPLLSQVFSGVQQDPPPVIPPSAVELHNEITGEIKNMASVEQESNKIVINGNGYEHKNQDNSYYIWYRDSEPNQADTQTMSYEYELLYQATKEAEYKSKLKVYVTSFILFFSIVLLLLIFSPVIYRYFFTSPEESEEVIEETSVYEDNKTDVSTSGLIPENQSVQTQSPEQTQSPDKKTESKGDRITSDQQAGPQKSSDNNTTNLPVSPSKQIEGVTRNSMGWMDEKNKVIYVQLENGKYTIQESAWDSDVKANKRINTVSAFLPELKGNVVKADLGSKGTWYRARFGEFTTLEEARKKAEELRSKEKIKLQAYLLSFLLFT